MMRNLIWLIGLLILGLTSCFADDGNIDIKLGTPIEFGSDWADKYDALIAYASNITLFQQNAQVLLGAHNQYRARHGSPPLTWSSQLAGMAQSWAAKLAPTGRLTHSNFGLGENLYWSSSTNENPLNAVTAWYNEVKHYNFQRPGFAPVAGHFTQLVWRGSRELGCGVAIGRGTVVSCNYSPPGNVVGRFPENVSPSSGRGRDELA